MAQPLAGIVLAGGRSRRLGTDKAVLRLGDRTLLAATVETLLPFCTEVIVVTNNPQGHAHPAARLVGDVFPGAGSLGGVYSGLIATTAPRCLAVACDMPFLNPAVFSYLAELPGDHDIIIPRVNSHLEPLHAIYSRVCLPHMRELLERGHLKIIDFFHKVNVRYVEGSELEPLDPGLRSFVNINTPQDLAGARSLLEGHG